MSVISNKKQFIIKMPSLHTPSISTIPCRSGSYLRNDNQNNLYIKIQDFELPEAEIVTNIVENDSINLKHDFNDRRSHRRKNILFDDTFNHSVSKHNNEGNNKKDNYLYKCIYEKMKRKGRRSLTQEQVKKYIKQATLKKSSIKIEPVKVNLGSYLFKPDTKHSKNYEPISNEIKKEKIDYAFDPNKKQQYLFKVKENKIQNVLTNNNSKKDKDIPKMNIKDMLNECKFKVNSKNKINTINEEGENKKSNPDKLTVIDKSEFLFKPQPKEDFLKNSLENDISITLEFDIQSTLEDQKNLTLNNYSRNKDESIQTTYFKQDKLIQDQKVKKEYNKNRNVQSTNSDGGFKGICSLFLCKLSNLY